ncbi:P-loop containing nucleoside triphosphate hydrolase [Phytophthora cactorum]|nr:P-loop containing nucleoside triphosphate hydrolase [Phytophthora cactorum]
MATHQQPHRNRCLDRTCSSDFRRKRWEVGHAKGRSAQRHRGGALLHPGRRRSVAPVYVEEVNEAKGLVTVRIQRPRKDRQNEDAADHDDADRTGDSRVVAMDVGFPLQNAQLSRYDEGLDNMIDLNHLHEAAILRNLKKRFELGCHTHIREISASHNQSILVSGESGAGKTETTKILMDNLATIAPAPTAASEQEHSITTRIIQVNPLLESFAPVRQEPRTLRCSMRAYLLEKTRVISHERGERNYHIFYQLLHGTTDEERDALGLGDEAPRFAYLEEKEPQQENRPGRKPKLSQPPPPKPAAVIEAENAKDEHYSPRRDRRSLCLDLVRTTECLFQVLSGILHLGEAQFVAKPDNDEACDLENDSVAAGEVYLVPLTVEQAKAGRDALAKAIYASIFDWLVAGINASLGAAARLTAKTIGVLDIFGFESFEHNSFEQLCINYANEKLQQKFTQDVFKAVQEEYEREQITWAHIAYADNSETLALIEGRMGVLVLLNEEIVRPRGNEEGFVSKLSGAYLKQKKLIEFPRISKTQFAIHHYAGTIKYEAMGFLEKHKDALLSDLSDLMCGSHEPFPQMLFKVKAEIEAAATAELKRQKSVPLYEKSCIVARAQIEETLSPTTSFCISQRYPDTSRSPKYVNIFPGCALNISILETAHNWSGLHRSTYSSE